MQKYRIYNDKQRKIKQKAPAQLSVGVSVKGGRRPTFPHGCSIIGAAGLNFSVRNGKRCAPAQWPPLPCPGRALRRRERHAHTALASRPSRIPACPARTAAADGRAPRRGRASIRAISAARLNASLRSHLRPIDVVVSHGPPRTPHLGAGFALRCLQRLSLPDAATRRCVWRRNRCTVGPSGPVLSY